MNCNPSHPPAHPQSLADLFVSFTWLSLQGFGGALAVAQRELVENKGWLSKSEFAEEWAVAQIIPGPSVINLAIMIGSRAFGWRGALASVLGMISVPFFLLMLLAFLHAQFATQPIVAGALRGMGAVAAGLIVATGMRLFPALKDHPLRLAPCIILILAAFVSVAILKFKLIHVLLGLGLIACLLTYRRMKK